MFFLRTSFIVYRPNMWLRKFQIRAVLSLFMEEFFLSAVQPVAEEFPCLSINNRIEVHANGYDT